MSELPIHPYDPVRACCLYDADSPVHDTTRRQGPATLPKLAAKLVPTRSLVRLLELAHQVRDPLNSAPLAELLDLLEEVARG